MKKFEVGKTYRYNHAGDHNLWVNCTITKRTEKTVTFSKHGNEYRVKLRQNDNEEFCFPNGIHSMCPVLSATDEVVEEEASEQEELAQEVDTAVKIMDWAFSCAYAIEIGISKSESMAQIRAYCDCWCLVTGKSRVEFYSELDVELAKVLS